MRKLLLMGLVVAVGAVGCESSDQPVGPGKVTVELSTSTTTSVIPALRFVASSAVVQAQPNLPSDMTLLLQQLATTRAEGPPSGVRAETTTYRVTGAYSTGSGISGSVEGQLVGSAEGGDFTGTLTANVSGCTARREFSGPMTKQYLQWSGGASLADCPGRPLSFAMFTLVGTDAPPPTTSASTTSVAPECTYALSSSTAQIGPQGGTAAVALTTRQDCSWTVQESLDWITITPPTAGSGPTTISYNVAENRGPQRTGTVIIAGVPFVVTQSAALADLVVVNPGAAYPNYCKPVPDSSQTHLAVMVRNQGQTIAPVSVTRVTFTPTGGIKDALTLSLGPDGSQELLFEFPDQCRPLCGFAIEVDATRLVPESDESNTVSGSCSGMPVNTMRLLFDDSAAAPAVSLAGGLTAAEPPGAWRHRDRYLEGAFLLGLLMVGLFASQKR